MKSQPRTATKKKTQRQAAKRGAKRASRGRPRGVKSPTTRDALLAAAEALMLEEGYAAVSSRRVAAKAGTDAALVYYYFGTMDDLFVALFRWGERRTHERHTEALASPQPLWAIWDAMRDPSSSVLTTEFIALANHRKTIRAELANAASKARQMQLERLSGVLESYGVDPKSWPPGAIILMLWGISLYLRTEEAFGVHLGHAETVELVERHIRALEGDRAGTPPPRDAVGKRQASGRRSDKAVHRRLSHGSREFGAREAGRWFGRIKVRGSPWVRPARLSAARA